MNRIRQVLRTRTRKAHDRVDRLFSTLDLSSPQDLSHFLRVNYNAYYIIEPLLTELPFPLVWPSRISLLQSDLRYLGETLSTHPDSLQSFAPKNLLGCAYVVGGSHFGQRILRKQWEKTEDIRVKSASSYLINNETVVFWNLLMTCFEKLILSDIEVTELIQSANKTFQLFEASFQLSIES